MGELDIRFLKQRGSLLNVTVQFYRFRFYIIYGLKKPAYELPELQMAK